MIDGAGRRAQRAMLRSRSAGFLPDIGTRGHGCFVPLEKIEFSTVPTAKNNVCRKVCSIIRVLLLIVRIGSSRSGPVADRKKLVLRNPIRLDDVPIDETNAIVFVLEYMVAIPLDVRVKPVRRSSK